MYTVKEIFYTLQGEGAQTGRAAVFCRFAGCNLWSGREAERGSAICQFCDTDFADTNGPGGGKFASAEELAVAVEGKRLPSFQTCRSFDGAIRKKRVLCSDDNLEIVIEVAGSRCPRSDSRSKTGEPAEGLRKP